MARRRDGLEPLCFARGAGRVPTTLRHVAAACYGRAWQNVAHDAPAGDVGRWRRALQWASPIRQVAGCWLPPYNIEALAEGDGAGALRVTLAVAGFSVDQLAVTVEDGQLVVRGQQLEERERDYIYRGIAARRFKRSFGLAEGVEVRKAELHNGLLAIEIERPVKEATVKTVRIVNGQAGRGPKRATVFDAE